MVGIDNITMLNGKPLIKKTKGTEYAYISFDNDKIVGVYKDMDFAKESLSDYIRKNYSSHNELKFSLLSDSDEGMECIGVNDTTTEKISFKITRFELL